MSSHSEVSGHDADADIRVRAEAIDLVDSMHAEIGEAVAGADLVIAATPVGACEAVAMAIKDHLAPGTIVTDVGSVKGAVITAMAPHIPEDVHLVPGHPVAGTEHSGPEAGFAELFRDRFSILTPPVGAAGSAVDRLAAFWRALGSDVEIMDSEHHDRVLAITSHLPHLIAYTIVGTATDLGDDLQKEVIQFGRSILSNMKKGFPKKT